jgi:hypothetical protein
MRNLLVLYKAELKRTWVIQVRYLGNTLGGIISVAAIFLASSSGRSSLLARAHSLASALRAF